VVYGGLNTGGVQDCMKPGVIALTFDDGPYWYTNDLLNLLDQYNAKATFFVGTLSPILSSGNPAHSH
jgi:peptidoglycan/xylan/chitin deacetylase (PgdA/CDA1 family)